MFFRHIVTKNVGFMVKMQNQKWQLYMLGNKLMLIQLHLLFVKLHKEKEKSLQIRIRKNTKSKDEKLYINGIQAFLGVNLK